MVCSLEKGLTFCVSSVTIIDTVVGKNRGERKKSITRSLWNNIKERLRRRLFLLRKENKEKELVKQIFAQLFGIKRGDWVKKKRYGKKTWVVLHIYRARGKKIARCWRNRANYSYRPVHYERISEYIPLSNLILIRDNKNPKTLAIPRS